MFCYTKHYHLNFNHLMMLLLLLLLLMECVIIAEPNDCNRKHYVYDVVWYHWMVVRCKCGVLNALDKAIQSAKKWNNVTQQWVWIGTLPFGEFSNRITLNSRYKGRNLTHTRSHARTLQHSKHLLHLRFAVWVSVSVQSPAGFRENVVESSNSSLYCVPNK